MIQDTFFLFSYGIFLHNKFVVYTFVNGNETFINSSEEFGKNILSALGSEVELWILTWLPRFPSLRNLRSLIWGSFWKDLARKTPKAFLSISILASLVKIIMPIQWNKAYFVRKYYLTLFIIVQKWSWVVLGKCYVTTEYTPFCVILTSKLDWVMLCPSLLNF